MASLGRSIFLLSHIFFRKTGTHFCEICFRVFLGKVCAVFPSGQKVAVVSRTDLDLLIQDIAALLPRMWRFGVALSGSRDTADDLVQATCVRAIERAHQFKRGTRLDSWLFTILSSIWRNQLRAERIRRGEGFVDADNALLVDGNTVAETKIFLRQVLEEVQRLPEAQRVTIFLVYVEGYKYHEAAEILDIPVGTVMSRLAAARKALSKIDEEVSRIRQ